MSAIDDVAAERKRQIEVEGWDAAHDKTHDNGDLATAGACYALVNSNYVTYIDLLGVDVAIQVKRLVDTIWPWGRQWWKPKRDRRRNLVRAAALIVAEIEKMDGESR